MCVHPVLGIPGLPPLLTAEQFNCGMVCISVSNSFF